VYVDGTTSTKIFLNGSGKGGRLMSTLKWQVRSQRAYYVAFMQQLVLHVTAPTKDELSVQVNLINSVEEETTKEALVEMLLSAYYEELLRNYHEDCQAHLDWLESGDQDERLTAFFLEGLKAAGGVLSTSIQIVPSDNPKCETANGFLVEAPFRTAALESPDSVHMDTQKYIEAAKRLKRTFSRYARKLSDNVSQALYSDDIAAKIDKQGDKINQIVSVFMEVVCDDMIK